MKIKKQKALRSKYKSINSSERALIIHYIEQYKYSTSHVSMITGHNASTIKAIYQIYKKEGRINKKVKRDKILNLSYGLMLFVVDDINGNLTRISIEQHETQKQIVEEEQVNTSKSYEQSIKQVLEQNKHKIVSFLDNVEAIDTFIKEVKIICQQEFPSQQFCNLRLSSCFKINDKKNVDQTIKKNIQNSFYNLSENQENTNSDEKSKSIVIKKLNEQYRQMKM
ncbi:unnamed protein product [Paramecium sonneborni]|uniref:Uncharacterized protein n=1 Tax=Paramecium sonneborni TaxID=65129 RepID=A0A8S1N4T5_9CILI|nr:unnamed protein product [Paramecium sonneborni]